MAGVYALIPAAGRGVRFGATDGKLFAPLMGQPVLGWTLRAFAETGAVDGIVLIGRPEEIVRLEAVGQEYAGSKVRAVVAGGEDRQASVKAGLTAAADADFVIVHDGARPCVRPEWIKRVLLAARASYAASAAVPVTDTLVRGEGEEGLTLRMGENVARDRLWAVQTPQAFHRDLLLRAHAAAESDNFRGTDDAGLVRRLGKTVSMVALSQENLKVTRSEDLVLAEAVLRRRLDLPQTAHEAPARSAGPQMRIGHGYDVHPFAEGRRLWLGGVEFPEAPRGLAGHSDADALLHAVCDALLGAASLGDIGKLFPPDDPVHRGRASIEFLRVVRAHLEASHWQIANVDITVLAEAPRIGPRADAIRATIAGALGIGAEQVSVKATTNEGMGFVGRSEGIAVHATALLFRP